jgi:hypothetical protein
VRHGDHYPSVAETIAGGGESRSSARVVALAGERGTELLRSTCGRSREFQVGVTSIVSNMTRLLWMCATWPTTMLQHQGNGLRRLVPKRCPSASRRAPAAGILARQQHLHRRIQVPHTRGVPGISVNSCHWQLQCADIFLWLSQQLVRPTVRHLRFSFRADRRRVCAGTYLVFRGCACVCRSHRLSVCLMHRV